MKYSTLSRKSNPTLDRCLFLYSPLSMLSRLHGYWSYVYKQDHLPRMLAEISSPLVRLTLRKKEEQKVLVSAWEFYQVLWSHDFEKSRLNYIICYADLIFMAEKMSTKSTLTFFTLNPFSLAFWHFSLLLVLSLLIFSMDFPALQTLRTSLECSNS